MKSFFYFALLLVGMAQVSAQEAKFGQIVSRTDLGIAPYFQTTTHYETLDEARLVVTYALSMTLAPGREKSMFEDVVTLEIGSKLSKYYSQRLHKNDLDWTKEERRSEVWIRNAFVYDPVGVEVYKYLPYGGKQKDLVTVRLFGFDDVYRYEDDKPAIHWKLTGDKKMLLGYNCQKAIGDFRGRTYEAWFTMDLPFRDGPYMFDGLPGLILDVKDTQGHYHWSCTAIKTPKGRAAEIKRYKWTYVTETRKYIRERVEYAYTHPVQYTKNTRLELLEDVKVGGDYPVLVDFSFPYNPIELE